MTHTADETPAGEQLSERAADLVREFESDTMSACHDLAGASARRQAYESRDALEAYIRTLEKSISEADAIAGKDIWEHADTCPTFLSGDTCNCSTGALEEIHRILPPL